MYVAQLVTKVAAGTPADIVARFYLGMKLIGGSVASSAVVHAGDSTADPQVGAAACAANAADEHAPTFPASLDHGVPRGLLHVEVTGTSAYALVYSTE